MTSALSFTEKILTASIKLGTGTFDGSSNVKLISGLRMHLTVKKGGHPSKNEATIMIFGMPEHDMNRLTTLSFKALKVSKNQISVSAGDINTSSIAFQGEITEAFADYKKAPEMGFEIKAMSGFFNGIAPVSPQSAAGGIRVSAKMSDLAQQMGYAFEMDSKNPVTAYVRNQYLQGSALEQAHTLAEAADCEFGVDDGTLWIAPRGQARAGTLPLISPTTGLIGYPLFDKKGIKVKCVYNPAIKIGGLVQVQSAIQIANGKWRVNGLEHKLESLTNNGRWDTELKASWNGE
jgi:hypothetical protein